MYAMGICGVGYKNLLRLLKAHDVSGHVITFRSKEVSNHPPIMLVADSGGLVDIVLKVICNDEITSLKSIPNSDFFGMYWIPSESISIKTYEGCLLYFGIREQKQILIIENRFIVFQNIPH